MIPDGEFEQGGTEQEKEFRFVTLLDGWLGGSSHVSQVSTRARRIITHAYPEILEAAPKLAFQQIQQLLVEEFGVQLADPESGPVLARGIGMVTEEIADRGA